MKIAEVSHVADDRSGEKRSASRRLAAVTILAVLAIFGSLQSVLDLPGVRGHCGCYFDDPDNPVRITALAPGEAADAAGLKAGDIIDLDRLYPSRITTIDPIVSYKVMPGTRVDFPVIRGSQRLSIPVIMGSKLTEPTMVDVVWDVDTLMTVVAVLLGAWLVIRRPSITTWSLYGFLVATGGSDPQIFARFGWAAVLAAILLGTLLASAWVCIIAFAATVPSDTPSQWRAWFKRATIALFAVTLVGSMYSIIAWSLFGLPQRYVFLPAWIGYILNALVYGLMLLALSINFGTSRGEHRARLKWIIPGVLFVLAPGFAYQYAPGIEPLYGVRFLLALLLVAGYVAIAYAIASGRIVDVRFAASRAVVATVLAGSIIIAFALLDWLVSKKLQVTRLGTAAEIGLAIALGFWFNALHRNVDTLVDRVFFRKRYDAERQLTLSAHAVLHSTSTETIRETLVDEVASALGLASAALFEPLNESTWRRKRAIGWNEDSLIDISGDDRLIRHLEAEQISLRISTMPWHPAGLPKGLGRPVLAIPVLARRKVVAIALYGQHTTGVDLDIDEVRAIERATEAAGAAYDHVEAETWRRRCESLEQRMAQLQVK